MNMLTNATPNQTMTSIDLLKMINDARAHNNEPIIRLNKFAEKIEDELEGDHYTKSVVQNSNNTESAVYHLTLDQCTLVAMRESKGVRRNVLDQLKQLQAPRQPSKIELAQWFIESETKLAQVTEQLAIAAPKAAAHDRIADAAGLFGVREAAKILGIKQNQLVSFLLDRKWAYRDERKTLQGYADKLNAGYIEHIFSPPVMTSEGEKVFNTMRLTAKGVSRIGEILAKGVAA